MAPLRRARSIVARVGVATVTVATAVLGSALPASSVPSTSAGVSTPSASASALVWTGCGEGFQCATLRVALDTTASTASVAEASAAGPARTVDLAVVRAKARDHGRRIGSLVVNPGGPGVPAVQYLRSVASSLPGAVRDRFDLVAFDPRGVGESERVDCVDSLDPLFDQSFEPTTDAARAALVDSATWLAGRCEAREGDFLAHVSTADAVRDLEQLRVALADERLSFLGSSYGTFLGASYAQAHPDRVRTFVLDGPVDPSMSVRAATLAQARGFEHALDDFLADCSNRRSCAFHHGGHAASAYDALRAEAARTPLATADPSGRTLNQTRFDAAVLEQLYFGRTGWPTLAEALSEAGRGDASTLLAGADTFAGRGDDGRDDDVLEAFWAVSCLDGPVARGVAAAEALERAAVGVAPRLGAFVVNNSLPCSVWPVPPVAPPDHLTAAGAPPILVIGTTEDPATPLVQARALAASLEHGRLLVADGEQHTSFDNGNACVDAVVTRYLIHRRIPRPGTRC